MREMKIRIKNPEHSERVQQALFKLGCKWADGSVSVCNLKVKALYVEDMSITFSSSDNISYKQAPKNYPRFENISLPEYHLNSKGEFIVGPEPTLQELLKSKIDSLPIDSKTSSINWGKLTVPSDSVKLVTIGIPVQVRSRKEVTLGRIKELADGVKYCANKGEAIPQDWLYELLELNSTLEDILSDESEEK